ncbi:MAG TPA: pyridoxamine 5'-phosphate oxidase family protein [Candidatus Saccharimonadales bacterium]|nr:pyridoxamine 5'-phosphate oxidase family protein [Candidatus Saccharimonadales bacterium]
MNVDVEKVIREYLPRIVHMSLGTSKDNRPWVCEVHFVYDEHLNLYFRSLTSRRHSQEIATNPHVAGNIVRQHAVGEYPPLGVYFEGTAAMLTDEADRKAIEPVFKERLQNPADILADAQNPDGHQFYKITVDNWYVFGKLDGDKVQKHVLVWKGGAK